MFNTPTIQKAFGFFITFYAIFPRGQHPHQFSRHPFIIIIGQYKHLILPSIYPSIPSETESHEKQREAGGETYSKGQLKIWLAN